MRGLTLHLRIFTHLLFMLPQKLVNGISIKLPRSALIGLFAKFEAENFLKHWQILEATRPSTRDYI